MFCQKCGKPSESVICPECAAAEAAVEAPVAESVQPVEAPVEAPAEEVATAVEEPAIQLGETTEEAPKKKSKKGLWISLVAIVAALAVAAVAFWPTIIGWFSSPEEQFRDVTRASLSSYTEALSNAYGVLVKGDAVLEGDYNTAKGNISLELDSSLATTLATALKEQGINLNAEDLTNVALSLETTKDNDLLYLGLNAGLKSKELLAVKAFLDIQNSVSYLGIPALSEQYLKLDLKALFGIDLANLNLLDLITYGPESVSLDSAAAVGSASNPLTTWMELLDTEQFDNLRNALPSEEEFNAMLNRYIDVALEQITNVEESTEDVIVNGHTQSQKVLTAKIDQALLIKIGKAVLQEAKTDATIKSIVTEVEKFAGEVSGQTVNLYDQLVSGIDSLIAEADAEIAEAESDNYLLSKTYVDGDEVLGYNLTVSSTDEQPISLGYNTVEEGGTYYFQVTANGMAFCTGSYVEEGDTTKGEVQLPIQGVNFTLGYEVSPTKETYRLNLPSELLSGLTAQAGIPAGFLDNLALEVSFAHPSEAEASVRFAVLNGDAALVALNYGVAGGNTTVTLPTNTVDPTDQTQLGQWFMGVVNKLPDLLSNLGLSQNMINELLLEVMGGMF